MVLKTGPEGELGQADPREVVTDPPLVLGPGLGRHREHVLGLVEGSPHVGVRKGTGEVHFLQPKSDAML